MMSEELQAAYDNLLRENTKLHAEKAHILATAEKHLKNAQADINQLHGIIRKFSDGVRTLVEVFFSDHHEYAQFLVKFNKIDPLRVGEVRPNDGETKHL